MDTTREEWEQQFAVARGRTASHSTMSGIELEAVYGSDDSEYPGVWPYTRGPYASMYRSKLWTMRQFAGFGTAEDTNGRFRQLLAAGGDGLSTVFDMPTLLGRDSDHELAAGEVGRVGVAVDSLADMAILFDGIDLGAVSTSMTINSAAPTLLAMYVAVADETGVDRARLGGTIQNDILKEYQAQKEFVFPPRPSMRLVTDVIRFAEAELPRWHPISISGYHIREAGSTAAEELAFTLANGFAYVEAALEAGLEIDAFAPRLSFFFNAHVDFFEEIAKYRAARRIWARWLRDEYSANEPRSMQLRFHTQTAGVSLTAQQPEVNVARVALEALAAVLGGTQSLHTDAFDEALALPTEKAARIALRTQQVIAHESGVVHVADPLGGSWFVEELTDELERRAEETFAFLRAQGSGSMLDGVIRAIEQGWFQGEIADAAYEFQQRVNRGEFRIVGVNDFLDDDDAMPTTLSIDPKVEDLQLARLAHVKAERNDEAVVASLQQIRTDASDPTINLVPTLIDAVKADVTVGEITAALEEVFGTWVERAVAVTYRVLVAKIGFDGHDRGIKIVARTLRDAGFEVIYAGLRQTPEGVAATALQEDVDAVGISMHNGAHLTIAPRVVDALRAVGARGAVVVGGIVPPVDIPTLHDAGVAAVLGPGASDVEVVDAITQACQSASLP